MAKKRDPNEKYRRCQSCNEVKVLSEMHSNYVHQYYSKKNEWAKRLVIFNKCKECNKMYQKNYRVKQKLLKQIEKIKVHEKGFDFIEYQDLLDTIDQCFS